MWWCYKKSIKISFFFFFCLILQWQTTNNRGLNRILISQSALCCGCWCHLPFLICYSILHFLNPDLLELTKVREKSAPCPVNSPPGKQNGFVKCWLVCVACRKLDLRSCFAEKRSQNSSGGEEKAPFHQTAFLLEWDRRAERKLRKEWL